MKLSRSSQTHKKLPVKLAAYMLQLLPVELKMNDEPMFELSVENIEKIGYLCDVPFASFGGEQQYITLEEKAAAIFYSTIKNHLFPNGNKRTAVILTCGFLVYNEKYISISPDELYRLSLKVAESKREEKAKFLNSLTKLFKDKIDDIENLEG